MKLGLTPWNFADLSASSLTEQAAFGESLGYESFWLPENHFNDRAIPDPLMLLAGVAAGTKTIRLATTSFLLPLRNPLLAAEQVAVLDRLSNGRVLLGIGRGYSKPMLRVFNIDPSEKRRQFEWALALMIRAWAGDPVSLDDDGEGAVQLNPLPLQRPHPPLWVAAFGPKALAQAGRLGLPYLASPIETMDDLSRNAGLHEEAVSESGHDEMTIRPIMRTVFVSDNPHEVTELRERLASSTLPTGKIASPDVDKWAIVGDSHFAVDKLDEYRELLNPTHLIVTRLRVEGLEEPALRRSVEKVTELM